MAHLIIRRKNHDQERTVILRRAETLVGRGPACQVRFPNDDPRVSHIHARIIRDQSGYWIENKGKNGTGLNNRLLSERSPLRDDDRISILDYELLFKDDPIPPLPPPRFAVVARVAHGGLPSSIVIDRLPALYDFCRFAVESTLRRADLLEQVGPRIHDVIPEAETICILLERAGSQASLQIEIGFPLEGRATSLEPDLCVAASCLEAADGLLCEPIGVTRNSESAETAGSAMVVPLKTKEADTFGALWLAASTNAFRVEHVQLLQALADVLALALENGRSHETSIADALRAGDNKIARRIQKEFLPRSGPNVNDYSFFHYYEPALSVGGDYYDYIWLPHKRLAILVADVAGKGVPAALLMSRLSAEARYCLMAHPNNLGKAIEELNNGLSDVLGERFITLAVCVLTPSLHRVEIACAGHEPPRILRAGTQILELAIDTSTTGSALGFVKGEAFFTREIQLEPGDNLLLFTDGVTDARDSEGNSFGLEPLLNVPLRSHLSPQQNFSATSLGQSVINEVLDHIADHPQFDDITLVCFGRERENVSDTGVSTRELPPPAA